MSKRELEASGEVGHLEPGVADHQAGEEEGGGGKHLRPHPLQGYNSVGLATFSSVG